MLLFSAASPPFMKNGYVLACERTREAVVIDPGDEVGELLAFVTGEALTPKAILLTHAHIDHVSGVAEAKRALRVPVWLHPDDKEMYARVPEQAVMFGLALEQLPSIDRWFGADGEWDRFGDYQVVTRHTPGHCPGNVCLAVSRVAEPVGLEGLFVGDTLFAGSVGRTDLPGGDHPTLMRAITEVLFSFPDEAIVHSGHGPDTTIGRERQSNPFVLDWLEARGSSPDS